MGFVHPDQPDIVVIYDRLDDEPGSRENGWVTSMFSRLRMILAMKLGRATSADLMLIESGRGASDPAADRSVRGSATLVVVLTPALLKSAGLGWLRSALADRRAGTGHDGVFVVELVRVGIEERPPEVADLLGYRFYAEDPLTARVATLWGDANDPSERAYFERLYDLGTDLVRELKRERGREQGVQPSAEKEAGLSSGGGKSPASPVFLAEVTDDLEDARDEVRRNLEQLGVPVLPGRVYPRDSAEAFRAAARAEMARASLFVQLLGPLTGRRLAGSDLGVVGLQYEEAVSLGVPVMQWRDRRVDPSGVGHSAHRALLGRPSVMACDLAEFKAEVARRIRSGGPPARPTSAAADRLVFVNPERPDLDLTREVVKILERHAVGILLPLPASEPSLFRAEYVTNLTESDGLVLIACGPSPAWVRHQLLQSRKVLPQRSGPLRALAIVCGGVLDPGSLGIRMPDLHLIDGRSGLDEADFRAFLAGLQGGRES